MTIQVCPICGARYEIHPMTVRDQSLCAACEMEQRRMAEHPTVDEKREQERRRQHYFNR